MLNQAYNERDLLKVLSFPSLNKIVTTTKDEENLYIVINLAEGTDLVNILRAYKSLPEALIKLIAA